MEVGISRSVFWTIRVFIVSRVGLSSEPRIARVFADGLGWVVVCWGYCVDVGVGCLGVALLDRPVALTPALSRRAGEGEGTVVGSEGTSATAGC